MVAAGELEGDADGEAHGDAADVEEDAAAARLRADLPEGVARLGVRQDQGPRGEVWPSHSPLGAVSLDVAVLVAGALGFLLESGNVIVRIALRDGDVPVEERAATLKGGRLIGPIERVLVFALTLTGAFTLAQQAADTRKRGDGEGQSVGTVDRENLWTVQTPQVFRREIIFAALAKVRDEGLSITDDTAACEALGQSVKLVECDQPNPKATRPADLPYIESLLAE